MTGINIASKISFTLHDSRRKSDEIIHLHISRTYFTRRDYI